MRGDERKKLFGSVTSSAKKHWAGKMRQKKNPERGVWRRAYWGGWRSSRGGQTDGRSLDPVLGVGWCKTFWRRKGLGMGGSAGNVPSLGNNLIGGHRPMWRGGVRKDVR